jgi:hypothetical protein
MKFTAILRVHPQGPFGVPDGESVVIPVRRDGTKASLASGPIDVATLKPVGYGTLPEYRKPEEALKVGLSLLGNPASFEDNFLTVHLEAADDNEARLKIRRAVTRFLRRLEIQTGVAFYYDRVKMVSADGVVDRDVDKARVKGAVYDIGELSAFLKRAEGMLPVDDPTFEHALFYFEHAVLLLDRMEHLTERFNEHTDLVASESFLHLWKAITLVVGDTARKPPDDVVARCKALGFPADYYTTVIVPISRLRHDFDVAHSTPDELRVKEPMKNLGTAMEVAKRVLQEYARYRQAGGAPFA